MLVSLPAEITGDEYGTARYLSIASAPQESELSIIIRERDTAFKRYLATAPLGAPLVIESAKGALVLDSTQTNVCIAGGIGIVPFLSIIASIVRLPSETYVFAINRTPETAVGLAGLSERALQDDHLHLIPVFTRSASLNAASGIESGHLNPAMLRHVSAIPSARFLVTGAHEFVSDTVTMLVTLGIPQATIVTEEFCGYGSYRCPHCAARYAAVPKKT